MICVIHAHPYPLRSRNIRTLLEVAQHLPNVSVRSIYQLYPDFDIDVPTEQAALLEADQLVWLHPLYWYSVPAMLKLWFEQVLLAGWAYGAEGTALQGKPVLWATSTGGNEDSYGVTGNHTFTLQQLQAPIQQTALYCGMQWQEPFVIHNAFQNQDVDLAKAAQQFEQRLHALAALSKGSAS